MNIAKDLSAEAKAEIRKEIEKVISYFGGEVTMEYRDQAHVIGGLPWNLVCETGSRIIEKLGLRRPDEFLEFKGVDYDKNPLDAYQKQEYCPKCGGWGYTGDLPAPEICEVCHGEPYLI